MPFNHLTYIMKTTSGFSENCHFGMSKLTFKSFQSYNEVPKPGVFHQWHFKLKNFKNMLICLKEKKKSAKESSEEILKCYFALFECRFEQKFEYSENFFSIVYVGCVHVFRDMYVYVSAWTGVTLKHMPKVEIFFQLRPTAASLPSHI